MPHDDLQMIEYRDQPAILVLGDTDEAIALAHRAAEAADCRIVAAAPIAEASDRLDRLPADAIYAEIRGGDADDALAPLLDRLGVEAALGRPSVVAAPLALVDLVAARAWNDRIALLADPTPADRAAALALASRPAPARLNDVGRQAGPLLHQLSEDAARIANILASLSGDEPGEPPRPDAEADEPAMEAPAIRALIRARRLRDQYFQSELFADPAWDMLLDLMAARLEQSRVAVSSLCIAAAVPATTALRWIKALTDRGLLVRSADPRDGRRVYIALSDEAARALNAYLRAVQRIAPAVI
jgi:DNA-binding MarR family transcriptional regulator